MKPLKPNEDPVSRDNGLTGLLIGGLFGAALAGLPGAIIFGALGTLLGRKL